MNDIDIQNDQDPKPTIEIKSIEVSNIDYNDNYTAADIQHTSSYDWWNRKYTLNSVTFNIKGLEITGTGLTDNTEISINLDIKYGNTTKNSTITYHLSDIK